MWLNPGRLVVVGGSVGGTVIMTLMKIIITGKHIFVTIERNEIQKSNSKVTMIRFQNTLNQIQKMYHIYESYDSCDMNHYIGGTTLDCIISSLVDTHLSATFGFGSNHIRM